MKEAEAGTDRPSRCDEKEIGWRAQYPGMNRARIAVLVSLLALCSAFGAASAAVPDVLSTKAGVEVVLTVDVNSKRPISPYIYGTNRLAYPAEPAKFITLDRAGGNRWTAYNWENNASNAGSDYNFQSDSFLGTGPAAESVRLIIDADQKLGLASLITVQLQGRVAADTAGPVAVGTAPDPKRFKEVVFEKKMLSADPFTTSPPTSDAYVYMDEFLWALDQKFPGARIFSSTPKRAPVFVSIDNEPELWASTHKEIQGGTVVNPDLYIHKSLQLAAALKALFPEVVIFGPAHYGFYGLYSWQGTMTATVGGRDWFVDRYARAIQTESVAAGRPLIDVYDIHWYSEATDSAGRRVTQLSGPALTDDEVQAVVQSPRSFADPTYTERSWVAKALGGPVNIIGRMKSKLAASNPKMKLAFTEYYNGGGQHIAGALAEADTLGIFGKEGVFAACLWPIGNREPYINAGFRAFRNFDSAGTNFGDLSLGSTSSSPADVVLYAAADSGHPGHYTLVLINRVDGARIVSVRGLREAKRARVFQMTADTPARQGVIAPVPRGETAVTAAGLQTTLPPLSVTTIDVSET